MRKRYRALRHLLLTWVIASFIFCQKSVAVSITVNSVSPDITCAGGSIIVDFTATGYPGTPTFTAELSDVNGDFMTFTLLGNFVSNGGDTINGTIIGEVPDNSLTGSAYKVRVYKGTKSDTSNSFSIYAQPSLEILSAPDSICSNMPVDIVLDSEPNAIFIWYRSSSGIGGSLTDTLFSPSDTINSILTNDACTGGLSTTFYIEAELGGCKSYLDSSIAIVVKPRPKMGPALPVADSICNESSATISLIDTCGSSLFYWWRVTNDSVISTNSNGGNSPIVDVLTNITNKNQTAIFGFYSTLNGCESDTDSVAITVYPTPGISLINVYDASLCSGTPFLVDFTDSVVGSTHTWYRDTVTNLTGDYSDALGETTAFTFILNSSDDINTLLDSFWIVSEYSGCLGGIFDTVLSVFPIPTFTASTGQPVYCSNESPEQIDLSSSTSGTFSFISTGSTTISIPGTKQQPDSGSSTHAMTFSNDSSDQTMKTVNVTFVSEDECPSTNSPSLTIKVNPNPKFDTLLLSSTICSGVPFTSINFDSSIVQIDLKVWYNLTVSVPNSVDGDMDLPLVPNKFDDTLKVADYTSGNVVNYDVLPVFIDDTTCNGIASNYKVHVNGLPSPPSFIKPIHEICGNEMGAFFSVNEDVNASVTYNWNSIPGDINKYDVNTNNALFNFDNSTVFPGDTVIIFVYNTIETSLCTNFYTDTIVIDTFTMPDPGIIQKINDQGPILACFDNDIVKYQWGKNRKDNLEEILLESPSNDQIYIFGNAETFNTDLFFYWVITYKKNGSDTCQTKAFYNSPIFELTTGVPPDDSQISIKNEVILKLFPNPNSGAFMFSLNNFSTNEVRVSIIDLMGKTHFIQKFSSIEMENAISLNIELTNGIYLLRAMDEKGKSVITKFIVQ